VRLAPIVHRVYGFGAGSVSTYAVQKDSLTLIDSRTGKSYEFPVDQGAVRAMYLGEDKRDFVPMLKRS
jgi:hypothetical protein